MTIKEIIQANMNTYYERYALQYAKFRKRVQLNPELLRNTVTLNRETRRNHKDAKKVLKYISKCDKLKELLLF